MVGEYGGVERLMQPDALNVPDVLLSSGTFTRKAGSPDHAPVSGFVRKPLVTNLTRRLVSWL
jgi:hypothetical protein